MGKFKVGDKVKVKSSLETGKKYGYAWFATGMVSSIGKEFIIKNIYSGFYTLNEYPGYNFSDEMLESVEKPLPRNMLVWDSSEKNAVELEVVYIHTDGRCAAINISNTLQTWNHCKDIPEQTTIEVTMDEIASKFGVNVNNLKIKK